MKYFEIVGLSGIDLWTGEEVAIKFATESLHYSLDKEFVNYLYLGADGRFLTEMRLHNLILKALEKLF